MKNNSTQIQQKKRLPEMDVMKGILSILVILGHIIFWEQFVSGVELTSNASINQNIFVAVWIAPYYMAAFFFVTGFCSSFKYDIKSQIISDAKHLLLPSITIVAIMSGTVALLGKDIGWSYAAPWFLWSMFWAKILFRVITFFFRKETVAWFFLVIMSIIGSTMMYYMLEANYLGYQQALVFPFFLALGHKARSISIKSWVYYLAGGFYALLTTMTFYILKWGFFNVSAFISFSPEKWPVYILLAASGSLGIAQISRLLSKSKVLQYIGRNSLIVYLMHGAFLIIVTSYLKSQIVQYNDNSTFQQYFFILVALGALLWSCLWAWVLNLPYLRWLQGKFS